MSQKPRMTRGDYVRAILGIAFLILLLRMVWLLHGPLWGLIEKMSLGMTSAIMDLYGAPH